MKPRSTRSLPPPSKATAADALFDTLYSELHRLARRELARQGPVAGLGVTTLLHEAYLTISGREGMVFPDRARFMAYAARVMRGLIIDDVRRRRSQKRGGLFEITSLGTDQAESVRRRAGAGPDRRRARRARQSRCRTSPRSSI